MRFLRFNYYEVGNFMQNLHALPYLHWNDKLVVWLSGVFGFLQMTLRLNKFAHPCCGIKLLVRCETK